MKTRRIGAVALVLTCCASAVSVEPPRDGQQAFLSRAVFLDGRVWLLTDAGQLSSITEGEDRRVEEQLAEPAHDICVQDGKLLAITCDRDHCDTASLRQFDQGSWSLDATFQVDGEHILALACGGSRVTVLTTGRLVDLFGSGRHEVSLSQPLGGESVSTVHGTSESVFVGFNAGEWGGGMRRIDRRTGNVKVVESNTSGELCGGPLNTECDPVTGITSSPRDAHCVVATIGLVHFFPRGRVVEVCGETVRQIYSKKYTLEGFRRKASENDGDFSTSAFFGLSRQGSLLWAGGIDGIHKIGPYGTSTVMPIPKFKEIGGVYVNFDSPEMILVLTKVNQRRSISGAVPLLVPR